jgi:hypothetical protein
MKNISKYFAVALLLVGVAASSFAQVSATANASAIIVTPIAISRTAHMDFGNVAVSASGGTVVLAPAGGRSTTGGVTLPATTGSPAAAAFHITGASGYTYAITLPAAVTTISSGANDMTVDTWTSTPNATGTLTGGADDVTVGATLHVSANQAAGIYTSATPFTVTVNYN